MKIKFNTTYIIIYAVFAAVLATGLGCAKQGPAKAIVTVVDGKGAPVAGAVVTLHQDTIKSPVTGQQANISDVETTDSDGKAEFQFSLEAILNVDVKLGPKAAYDYIRLEQS